MHPAEQNSVDETALYSIYCDLIDGPGAKPPWKCPQQEILCFTLGLRRGHWGVV